jgi:hypothetical protein
MIFDWPQDEIDDGSRFKRSLGSAARAALVVVFKVLWGIRQES